MSKLKPMTVIEFIELLEQYPSEMPIAIHVPGDDVGYWPNPVVAIDRYADKSKEQYVKITIY